MTITKDATKGWALPASAAEWTELLSGTGIANPDHAWPCQIASGDLSDVIGSLALTARTTPIYSKSATGWTSTGVGFTDASNDGFIAASGTGPDPSTTSQTWVMVVSIETEATLSRNIFGMNAGASGISMLWAPSAGTNRLRVSAFGSSTIGTADHSAGSYVFTLRYDRAVSATKATSDIETITGTYSASAADGDKGPGATSNNDGGLTILYVALWEGSNAEALDDTDIGTIRSKIESPPADAGTEITADLDVKLGDITLSSTATVGVRPGSTLTQLQAGGGAWKYVLAVEGYPYLFTDADPDQAVSAWDGLDWTQAIGNVKFDLDNEQSINPWDPFTHGGSLSFAVVEPASSDQFGVDVFRRTAGDETMLNATIDRDDTTMTVLSTADFDSSGTVYCGTETIGYTGKTATTFTGLTRGKFAPFSTASSGAETGSRWGHRHQVFVDPNAVKIKPLVTSQPRTWIGRWVGLWLHRWDQESGLLNARDNAQLVFAGRIAEIADDPSNMATVVHCEHVLDYVGRAVVGRDMFTAEVKEGMLLRAGMQFDLKDSDDSASFLEANPLIVKPSGANGSNQIDAGFYTNDEVITAIGEWLAAEREASRINGRYTIARVLFGEGDNKEPRTHLRCTMSGSDASAWFQFTMPTEVNRFLGTFQIFPSESGRVMISRHLEAGTSQSSYSTAKPLRSMMAYASFYMEILNTRGTFVDQNGSLPAYNNQTDPGEGVGAFIIDGRIGVYGTIDDSTSVLRNISPAPFRYVGADDTYGFFDQFVERAIDDEAGPTIVKQVLFYQGKFADAVRRILYSTGTEDYNHSDYDSLPYALGVGIPGELLGSTFEASLAKLPGAAAPFTLVIDEPTQLADAIRGALTFRWSFLRWKSGGLQFCTWKTPVAGQTLNETNKATPVGTDENPRAATVYTSEWQKQVIKVDYDRDIKATSRDGGYRSSLTVVDRVAVEDASGDAKSITLQLRDTYGTDVVDSIKGQFIAGAAQFTRPISKLTRSIDSRFFEGYSVGDTVKIRDNFARDPDTGKRSVTTRAATIIRHRWTLGGAGFNGEVSDISGEVDVMLGDRVRSVIHAPTAQIDDTATNSGYDSDTKVITTHDHVHTETNEALDATHFPIGSSVTIIEIDPADPTDPSIHTDTVAGQSTNTITLTDGFTGFDSNKKYRIIPGNYADASTTQQAGHAFLASSTAGTVDSSRVPYQYAVGASHIDDATSWTANAADDAVELPPDAVYADGAPLDVGHQAAINRLINNLVDYKTAISSPFLVGSTGEEMSGNGATGTYVLTAILPIFLTREVLISNTVTRLMTIAPLMKSSDGASASVRVTLTKRKPTSESLDDVDRESTVSEATFTTTSTTYTVPTAKTLDIAGNKHPNGLAYLLIECTSKARCLGLAECQEGARQ